MTSWRPVPPTRHYDGVYRVRIAVQTTIDADVYELAYMFLLTDPDFSEVIELHQVRIAVERLLRLGGSSVIDDGWLDMVTDTWSAVDWRDAQRVVRAAYQFPSVDERQAVCQS